MKPMRMLAAVAVGAAIVRPAAGATASASHRTPVIQPRLFAAAPKGASKPDDITLLNGLLYVTYQNNAGKDGTPPGSTSTIVAFDQASGAVVATYSVLGRCDGVTADPAHGRILACSSYLPSGPRQKG